MHQAFGAACSLFYRRQRVAKGVVSFPPSLLAKVEQLDKEFLDELEVKKVLRALSPLKRVVEEEVAGRLLSIEKALMTSLSGIEPLLDEDNFLLEIERFRSLGVRRKLKQ